MKRALGELGGAAWSTTGTRSTAEKKLEEPMTNVTYVSAAQSLTRALGGDCRVTEHCRVLEVHLLTAWDIHCRLGMSRTELSLCSRLLLYGF
jgi:hypothetical protein